MTPAEGGPVRWMIDWGDESFSYFDNQRDAQDRANDSGAMCAVVPLFTHAASMADAAPFTYAVVNRLGDVVAGSKIEGGAAYRAKLVQRAEDLGETSADGPYRVVPLYTHPAAASAESIRAEVIEECAKVCEAEAKAHAAIKHRKGGHAAKLYGKERGAEMCAAAIRALSARATKEV